MKFGVGPRDRCPCGSGRTFVSCCGGQLRAARFPLGAILQFGPDDQVTTLLQVLVLPSPGGESISRQWTGNHVDTDGAVQAQIEAFLREFGVRDLIVSGGNLGCPREAVDDYPEGDTSPCCSDWLQGCRRRVSS